MNDAKSLDLETWQWLASVEGRACIKHLEQLAIQSKDKSENQILHAARRALSPERAALVVDQMRLRARATKKFRHPEKWIWTAILLEQASDQQTAEFVASHYPASASIIDFCCGAGSDAVALSSLERRIRCVDSSEQATLIASSNLTAHSIAADVTVGLAEEFPIPVDSWIHIDPDRRPSGTRVTQLASVSPDQNHLEQLIQQSVGGSIKLAPATELPQEWRERMGSHWISTARIVRQLRVWWGSDSFPAGTHSASMCDAMGVWHTFQKPTGEIDSARRKVRFSESCGTWIADYDATIRTADLTCSLAEEIHASVIANDSGYLTSHTPRPHAMVNWFRVIDILPADTKKLRMYLRHNNVGILELKQRGTGLDLERLRRDFKLCGDQSRTLLFFRAKGSIQAVIAERCDPTFNAVSTDI